MLNWVYILKYLKYISANNANNVESGQPTMMMMMKKREGGGSPTPHRPPPLSFKLNQPPKLGPLCEMRGDVVASSYLVKVPCFVIHLKHTNLPTLSNIYFERKNPDSGTEIVFSLKFEFRS